MTNSAISLLCSMYSAHTHHHNHNNNSINKTVSPSSPRLSPHLASLYVLHHLEILSIYDIVQRGLLHKNGFIFMCFSMMIILWIVIECSLYIWKMCVYIPKKRTREQFSGSMWYLSRFSHAYVLEGLAIFCKRFHTEWR